jgi:hypothetical protein
MAATIATTGSLVGILAALGVVGGGSSAELALAAALGKVQDAGTSRMEVRLRILSGEEGELTATGVFDYRRRVGRLRFSRRGEAPVTFIYDRDVTYFRRADLRDGRWQKTTDQAGLEAGLSGLDLASDPSQQLTYLDRLADPKEVGDESVFGVPTKHYRGTQALDPLPEKPTIPSNVSAEQRRQIEESWPEVRSRWRDASKTFDAWIDANGLVRRLQVTTSVRGFVMQSVVDLHDFGVRVLVHPPRTAETFKPPRDTGAPTP